MRADVFLFTEGYARSREAARKAIESGAVSIDGKLITKPSEKIDENVSHTVEYSSPIKFVGRGGLKLEAALDAFGIDVTDTVCVDIGASTGGFTDCLLSRGAVRVYAVDSGHGQLARELAEDSRVVSIEGMNARALTLADLGEVCNIAVMDVSFISQTLILPQIPALLTSDGLAVTLIKPQFECGRECIGKGGIVRKPEHRLAAVRRVFGTAERVGLYPHAIIRSPIEGGDGNVEYLAVFKRQRGASHETLLGSIEFSH